MTLQETESSKLHLYTINYQPAEEDLCMMEIRHLFQTTPSQKFFMSETFIPPTRSPFLKECISILLTAHSVEGLIEQIIANHIAYDHFLVRFIETECSIPSEEKRRIEHLIGWDIIGEARMRSPDIVLAVSKLADQWVFGTYMKNAATWLKHVKKPQSYSTSLNTRVSRALVNIAVANNDDCQVVDPCCGIGTVLIEALSMGIDIVGYDINPAAVRNARINLAHFGYEDIVAVCDINQLSAQFDVAIVDIPYNLYSRITLEQQFMILQSARTIAAKLVLVTIENLDEQIRLAGFNIIDRCHIFKGKLKRHIIVCT